MSDISQHLAEVEQAARAVQASNEAAGDCAECDDVLCEAHIEQWTGAMKLVNGALYRLDRQRERDIAAAVVTEAASATT